MFDSKKDQVPLPGKRVPIFSLPEDKLGSPRISAPLQWPKSGPSASWMQAYRCASHDAGWVPLGDFLVSRFQQNPGSSELTLSAPLFMKGVIYTLNGDGCVYALDRKGEVLWRTELTQKQSLGGGLCADESGFLYVSTGARTLSCLDLRTGKCCWQVMLAAPARSAPVVAKGRILSLNMMNQLEVFDAKTGRPLFEHTGLAMETHILGGSSPAVCGSTVVVAHSSGEVIALSLDNGEILWQQSGAPVAATEGTYQLAHIRAHPVIHAGKVYTISYNDQLSCFELTTGQLLWKKAIGGIHSPVCIGNALYCMSSSNCLISLESSTGNILWTKSLPVETKRGSSWAGPVAGGRFLYVAGLNGKLCALDPLCKGKITQVYQLPEGTDVAPVIAEGGLLVITNKGTLVFFSAGK